MRSCLLRRTGLRHVSWQTRHILPNEFSPVAPGRKDKSQIVATDASRRCRASSMRLLPEIIALQPKEKNESNVPHWMMDFAFDRPNWGDVEAGRCRLGLPALCP